ncbi:acyltransferase family protein [Aeromicrobium tamlense]|uniref:Acyltransferase family protein n=1 Tax=Aeromicrobium tamlense TaxID=375541 RepID=A0A8I0FW69_9ACTN|nr:acyltransferase family protein [Aeromicrobium tamlense]MBD1270221.1 acyltransferase family protein [Aeromicrobium tamlense]NYI39121.1 surface polysaccharide O-acyltransferase-like enzyme [Aeromicrobium tamlense]
MTTATTPTATESTVWISWLRAIAIVGVVTIHSVAPNAAAEDARSTTVGTLAIWLDIGAVCAVPLFVMLSGSVLLDPRRYGSHSVFLRKRAARLVPALVFWHLWYWALVTRQDGTALPWRDALLETVTGELYTALYFFWIIIGLALITPLVIGFVSTSSRRAVLVAGAALATIPALSLATIQPREASVVLVETAWTWWFGYLGVYLLGWGLRGLRLRGLALAAVSAVTLALGALGCWQWRNPEAPQWLQTISPVSYYGAGTILYAIGVFLVAQALIQPDGLLRVLARGIGARLGTTLGAATLGVFGLHLTFVWLLPELGIGGDLPAAEAVGPLLGRLAITLVASFAIVLVLRRVPVVRSVL